MYSGGGAQPPPSLTEHAICLSVRGLMQGRAKLKELTKQTPAAQKQRRELFRRMNKDAGIQRRPGPRAAACSHRGHLVGCTAFLSVASAPRATTACGAAPSAESATKSALKNGGFVCSAGEGDNVVTLEEATAAIQKMWPEFDSAC